MFPLISGFLSDKHAEGVIDGYNLLFLSNAEQAAEEFVDEGWKSLVAKKYPLLYVFVQPNEYRDDVFDAFLREAGFIRIK